MNYVYGQSKARVMVMNRLAWLGERDLVLALQVHGWGQPDGAIYTALRHEAELGSDRVPIACDGWTGVKGVRTGAYGRKSMTGATATRYALEGLPERLQDRVLEALAGPRPLGETKPELDAARQELARVQALVEELELEQEARREILAQLNS